MAAVNWIEGTNVSISDGTITKNSGVANGYNAGAKGDQLYQSTDNIYLEVIATDLAALAFGFTKQSEPESVSNSTITYRVQLSTNSTYTIYANTVNIFTGNYTLNDVFKITLESGKLNFYLNDTFLVDVTSEIYFPMYIDGSIYKEEYSITAQTGKLPTAVRYIRDWAAGSDANGACIWQEIKVFRKGENIALGILPTSSVPLIGGTGSITDNVIHPDAYVFTNTWDAPQYVEIDLGQIYNDLETINVWHYYGDGRTFSKTKTEVSTDGVNWSTVFDSAITGTYPETIDGLTIVINEPSPGVTGEIILQTNQTITTSDVIRVDLDQKIARIGNVILEIGHAIHGKRKIFLDVLQEITTTRDVSLEVDLEIWRGIQSDLDLIQEVIRSSEVDLDLDQRIESTGSISLDLIQDIQSYVRISLDLIQNISGARSVSIDLREEFSRKGQTDLNIEPMIYRNDNNRMTVNQQLFNKQADFLFLNQIIVNDTQIYLQLRQSIRKGEIGSWVLGMTQDIYSRGGSILDLELQTSGGNGIALDLTIVTAMTGEIVLPLSIKIADYLTTPVIIGEIQITGERALYYHLAGDAQLYVFIKGAIDMTKTGQDISMFAGDTKILIVTIDEPINLEGASLKWGLRKNKNTKENLIVKDMTQGIAIDQETISITLDPVDTQDMSGDFYHEMELTDLFGNVSTLFVGKAKIEPSGV